MPYHRSEEHTSELQSHDNLVCRLLLEKKKRDIRKLPADTCGDSRKPGCTAHASCGGTARAFEGNRVAADTLLSADFFCFFFLKDAAPTDFSPLPPRTPFPN